MTEGDDLGKIRGFDSKISRRHLVKHRVRSVNVTRESRGIDGSKVIVARQTWNRVDSFILSPSC